MKGNDKRLWSATKFRRWLKTTGIYPPEYLLTIYAVADDGCFHAHIRDKQLCNSITIAVRRSGGHCSIMHEFNGIDWTVLNIDMHKSMPDKLQNAQLSLRLEGDI